MTASHDHHPSPEHISAAQSLRYYRSGLELSKSNHIWICLHGYGQLARFFMRKFSPVEDRVHLVFPEASHRYYREGNGGRVGASWMTKEDRLTDIENQTTYLDTLYKHVMADSNSKVTVIGFSQGAATASRWALSTTVTIDNLVLWSSAFPPDLPELTTNIKQKDMAVYQLIGTEDPYLKENASQIRTAFKAPIGLEVELLTFEGGHEIRPSELEIMADRILS